VQPWPQFLRRQPVTCKRIHRGILLKWGRSPLKGTLTFSKIEAAVPRYFS
jgi:hypothetical protein